MYRFKRLKFVLFIGIGRILHQFRFEYRIIVFFIVYSIVICCHRLFYYELYFLYFSSKFLGFGKATEKTMHHDIHCPLHIFYGEHELNANQLISISQTVQPKFELRLQNDVGEGRNFVFQPNRELPKTSTKVHFLLFSNEIL